MYKWEGSFGLLQGLDVLFYAFCIHLYVVMDRFCRSYIVYVSYIINIYIYIVILYEYILGILSLVSSVNVEMFVNVSADT